MRGKKTDPETIYKIMTSYAVTNNYTETANNLGMLQKTVENIVKANKGKEEFTKLFEKKKEEFANKASEIIDMGLKLIHRRLNTAIEHEDKLNELIDEIYSMPSEGMSEKQKTALINKIKVLELQKLSDITTAVGTLYDKRALAKGEATQINGGIIKVEIVDE